MKSVAELFRCTDRQNESCGPETIFIFYYFLFLVSFYRNDDETLFRSLLLLFCLFFLTTSRFSTNHLFLERKLIYFMGFASQANVAPLA